MSEQSDIPRTDAPEVIWLQTGDEDECNADHRLQFDSEQVTWCSAQQFDSDIKYVRADLYESATARIAELEKELDCNLQQMQTKF